MRKPFKCGKCDSLLRFCRCISPLVVDVFDDLVSPVRQAHAFKGPPEIIWEDGVPTIKEG